MSEERASSRKPKRHYIAWALLILFLFTLIGLIPWLIEMVMHLLIGFLIHAWKNLPPLMAQWPSLILPLACLLIAVALADHFVRWFLQGKLLANRWKAAHTIMATFLILLTVAAAIAMSGITHQSAWLAQEPWLRDRNAPIRAMAILNAGQVMKCLYVYQSKHQRYPDSLHELLADDELLRPEVLRVQTSDSETTDPFIFLKPGGVPSANSNDALIMSPILNSSRPVVIVGYEDTSVRVEPASAFETILKQASVHSAPKPDANE